MALFLSLGHHETLVRKLSGAFNERRRSVVQSIANHLPEWSAGVARSGTSIWLEGPAGVDTIALAARAHERGVLVEPGGIFFAGRHKPANYMRLGISSIPQRNIDKGVSKLAETVAELDRI